MAEIEKKSFFNRVKRGVNFAFVGGGVGAVAVLLAPAVIPSTVVLIGGFLGGAIIAKMTGGKKPFKK